MHTLQGVTCKAYKHTQAEADVRTHVYTQIDKKQHSVTQVHAHTLTPTLPRATRQAPSLCAHLRCP